MDQDGNNKQPHVDQLSGCGWGCGYGCGMGLGNGSKDGSCRSSRNNSITHCVNKNDGVEDKATSPIHTSTLIKKSVVLYADQQPKVSSTLIKIRGNASNKVYEAIVNPAIIKGTQYMRCKYNKILLS